MQIAVYVRVSTDKSDQIHSFEAQQRFFQAWVAARPEWTLYDIYADEGITGTSTRKRAAFNRMMDDARAGCFQRIVTKEVSRFSRNMLDTLRCTRALKGWGVGVSFLNDGIDTMEPDAELRLSIMGSIAQEESRKTSERVKWGQTRAMEQGVVFGRSMLGYRVAQGRLVIEPREAELVRRIFYGYAVAQKSPATLARELEAEGVPTCRGLARWSPGQIRKILANERYAGDLRCRKTYTADYLTHARRTNRGEAEMLYFPDHHPAIVDRALWAQAQSRRQSRSNAGKKNQGPASARYGFSGKIFCGVCGTAFVARRKTRKDGSSYLRWVCGTAARLGKAGCDAPPMLRDELAAELLRQTLAQLPEAAASARKAAELAAAVLLQHDPAAEERRKQCQADIRALEARRAAAMDACFAGDISRADLRQMLTRYEERLGQLRRALETEAPGNSEETPGTLAAQTAALLSGAMTSDLLRRALTERITLYPDGRAEVMLQGLPGVWVYQIERRERHAPEYPAGERTGEGAGPAGLPTAADRAAAAGTGSGGAADPGAVPPGGDAP